MKKLLSIIFLTVLPAGLFAQTGKVFDNLSMKSKILNMERKFAIYLPPDYETSQRSYPVLYLLHGAGDDQTGWVQFGEVLRITDEAIKSGSATAMIIVMPDANTGKRGYVNDIKGEWRYEDFFFQEFMPFIEKAYRIKGEKRYRAISGLSMGGEGTFIYALHHPELFSSACPLSAATGPRSVDELKNYRLWGTADNISEADQKAYFARYSVLSLIDSIPDKQKIGRAHV
jgi:enterochelin esterase-like enzyme